MMEDESELRTKLAVDIEKYQQDASISSAAASAAAATPTPTTAADAKAKNLDATLDEIVSPIASGMLLLLLLLLLLFLLLWGRATDRLLM